MKHQRKADYICHVCSLTTPNFAYFRAHLTHHGVHIENANLSEAKLKWMRKPGNRLKGNPSISIGSKSKAKLVTQSEATKSTSGFPASTEKEKFQSSKKENQDQDIHTSKKYAFSLFTRNTIRYSGLICCFYYFCEITHAIQIVSLLPQGRRKIKKLRKTMNQKLKKTLNQKQ